MEFYINDEKIDVTLENEKTVGDVLKSIELICEENEAAVIGIQINQQQITAEKFDEISLSPLNDDMCFKFSVITKSTIAESFTKLSQLFEQLAEKMLKVPVELQSGKDKEANNSIKELADSIQNFCHVAALASLFKEYISIQIDGKPFNEFFADFSPILEDFEQALKDNDTVTVGDLSEYEICPRLQAISEALKTL